MKNKNIIKKIVIIASGVLIVGAIGLGSYIGNYFYDLALNPDSPKDAIFGNGDDETDKFKTLNFPEVDLEMYKSKIFDKGHGTH